MADTCFSEAYGALRVQGPCVREEGAAAAAVPEKVLQCVWYDHLFPERGLVLDDGRSLRVVSPGWWNHGEGPDFKGAQLEIAGRLVNGDVEIHHTHGGWKAHGHHLDERYEGLILHVTLSVEQPAAPIRTVSGKAVPTLLLGRYLAEDLGALADAVESQAYPYEVAGAHGACSGLIPKQGTAALEHFLALAGDWRMLNKARALRERMDQASPGQAIYEAFLSACGYSHFKQHFQLIARHLPYDRVRQLALQDPLLAEAALLQIAGLLPDPLPQGTTAAPHYARIRALRRDHLPGLRALPLTWRRVGVRPNNNPERRLAGAARFLSRTAQEGLAESLEAVWREDLKPVARRRRFESLFPHALGFWANHCTWTGKRLTRATAPLGTARIRSIIGNVFIPAALASARAQRNRRREECIHTFYVALPKESDNQITKIMLPRVLAGHAALKVNFRMQQGLLQMYQDWCEPNPSCQNCALYGHLAARGGAHSSG
ncbi:MAG: DUF2851 family protein [Candidatus Hydrogenedentota bacterium]